MMDLTKLKKVHIIGIKGSGVVAVAEILKSYGIGITGSDTDEKFFTDEVLMNIGIPYFEKFDPENIPSDVDLVVYSTAYNETNNSEFKEAKNRGIPMMSYPEVLAELFNQKYGIAVCGTHGKTTTSAMLAQVMRFCGSNPSAVIGSKVIDWGKNALVGTGEFFVAETDEYQNKLRLYDPKAVIFTSCDYDHPDFFPTFADYKKAFSDFIARIPKFGFLIVWGDSTDTLEVAKSATSEILSYGFSDDCDYRSKAQDDGFEVFFGDESLGKFKLGFPGKHNILNATAVIAFCHKMKLDMEKVSEALANFKGTSRRFELIGERNGAILIDDYAHHPEEIKATLKAAKERYPENNIWAVFHPHTFTRTKALLQEFSQSFDSADSVIVIDIYGSAREAQGGVSSKELVDLINTYSHGKAEHIPTIPETIEFLKDKIGPNDVVISIGAGNVWEVTKELSDSK